MKARIIRTESDIAFDLDGDAWSLAEPIAVEGYWSGEPAPPERHFSARLLWSDDWLFARFEARLDGTVLAIETPDLSKKAIGLWERDVCEIFIGGSANYPRRYFEFEVAPTGEWLDLAIHQLPDRRETDWDFDSGMEAHARIDADRTVSAIKIPWRSIGGRPEAGEMRPGNLFRCVGSGPGRGYLAWSATMTPVPNFHVPERFGVFEFV